MNIIFVSIIKTPLTAYNIIIIPDSMPQTRDNPSIPIIDTPPTPEHTHMALVHIVTMVKIITRTLPVTMGDIMVEEAACHVCKNLCYTSTAACTAPEYWQHTAACDDPIQSPHTR